MFIRWQSRTRRVPANDWGKEVDLGDGVHRRAVKGTSKLDVHHSAILCRSVRIGGKPRQQHLAYLGGITDSKLKDGRPHLRFWSDVERALKGLGKGISADERRKVETILAKRVPRPPKTQWERHKRESEESQSEEEPSPEPMFLLRAAQAFALASYEGPSNKRVAKAARQAADVWEELATKLERQQ